MNILVVSGLYDWGSTYRKWLFEKSNVSMDEKFVKQWSRTDSTVFAWNWNNLASWTRLNDAGPSSLMKLLEHTIWSFADMTENACVSITSMLLYEIEIEETLISEKENDPNRVILFLWNSMSSTFRKFVNARLEMISTLQKRTYTLRISGESEKAFSGMECKLECRIWSWAVRFGNDTGKSVSPSQITLIWPMSSSVHPQPLGHKVVVYTSTNAVLINRTTRWV